MNRRQLAFILIVNALVSLALVLLVTWIVEVRRPDPEELAALYTPLPQPIIAATATPGPVELLPVVSGAGAQPVAATPVSGDQVIYIVQGGDSLLGIAARYNVTIDAIVAANNLANPDFVFSGQRLVIPVSQSAAATVAAQPERGLEIAAVEGAGALSSEAILLVNEGNAPVNLQGWRLERENGPAYQFGNVQLFAGSSIRVYSTSGEDNTIALYWKQSAPVWSSGAVVRLLNEANAVVDTAAVP